MQQDKTRKIQLYERILGLKHKLRVNESGHTPQNHHEVASLAITNWELEDEIKAIEMYLQKTREENIQAKLKLLEDPANTEASYEKPQKTKKPSPKNTNN